MTEKNKAQHPVSVNKLRHHRTQSGLVLVMVLGVVSLMITLLVLLFEDQHHLVRKVANQRVAEQSRHYAMGLEAWAVRVLHEDVNRLVDHADEEWAKFGRPNQDNDDESEEFSLDPSLALGKEEQEQAVIDFGIDTLEVTIEDLQGRYNLNNLVAKSKDAQPPVDQKRIFINLLEQLEIGEFTEDRDQLYWDLVDWLDQNDTSQSTGAESGEYQILSTPYFAGDQPLSLLGELRFVRGFSSDMIKKLRPYVVVLPTHNAKLNLNSVRPEVLASLSRGPVVDMGSVLAFLARKLQPGFQGFQGADIESAQTSVNGVSPASAGFVPNMLQVNSQFFQINSKVVLGDYEVCTRTVVLRQSANPDTLSDQSITVLSREQDSLCLIEEYQESEAEASDNNEDLR